MYYSDCDEGLLLFIIEVYYYSFKSLSLQVQMKNCVLYIFVYKYN